MVNVILKTILAGDGGVGKTSLVRSFMNKKFSGDYKITIGVDVSSKSIMVNKNKITFSVNDVAGQQRFSEIKDIFMKGAHLALLVFDVTRKDTLTNLRKQWIEPMIEVCPNIFSILIGNKADLDDLRVIERDDGLRLLELMRKVYPSMHMVEYIETSALQHKNVELAFETLGKAFLKANPT
ncbi:MAG: GTP-binding protein [Candidatus Thorarchaeota archaeon]